MPLACRWRNDACVDVRARVTHPLEEDKEEEACTPTLERKNAIGKVGLLIVECARRGPILVLSAEELGAR